MPRNPCAYALLRGCSRSKIRDMGGHIPACCCIPFLASSPGGRILHRRMLRRTGSQRRNWSPRHFPARRSNVKCVSTTGHSLSQRIKKAVRRPSQLVSPNEISRVLVLLGGARDPLVPKGTHSAVRHVSGGRAGCPRVQSPRSRLGM